MLQQSNGGRYICDPDGKVICMEGWEDKDTINPEDSNRCQKPVCSPPCKHGGMCTNPNQCACTVGW